VKGLSEQIIDAPSRVLNQNRSRVLNQNQGVKLAVHLAVPYQAQSALVTGVHRRHWRVGGLAGTRLRESTEIDEVEVSLVGSYNADAMRMELYLRVRAWEAGRRTAGVEVELID
jgi:hypothetical protein